jgi:predicted nucleotidyltransferase component of viral defense system
MSFNQQKLLATILDLITEKFGKRAILRGGMVLRILGSQRSTNDLDYVFVPYRSKNDIVKEIISCLEGLPGATIQHSLNSKCLRIVIRVQGVTAQIEAKVAWEMKTEIASNKLYAAQFDLPPRLIPIVDHPISMANKLAAWNERRLLRDIYDIWFFLRMNIQPDLDVLQKRLRKPLYAKNVRSSEYFKGENCQEFFDFIRQNVTELSQKDIETELSDYLSKEDLVGLALQFKAAFARLGTN